MSNKTFLTISKSECAEVYKEILSNAYSKWTAGEKLTETGDFGSATSMAIISVEEIVKALIVFLDGKGFNFMKVKGMDVIFRNHEIRHFIAYGMFVVGVFGEDLLDFINNMKKDPQSFIELCEHLKNDKVLLERKINYYALRKMSLFKKEFAWFSKADIFRQDGFYCGYEEQLKNPITITEADYVMVIARLTKVIKIAMGLIEGFSSEDETIINQVNQLKRSFRKNDVYGKIAQSLSTVRQRENNPFSILKQKIFHG